MTEDLTEVADTLGPFTFEFSGSARGRDRAESDRDPDRSYKLADVMNSRSVEITERMQRELKRMLPPGTEVAVEIDYFSGSLEWVGIAIIVLEWTARIADNISFVEYVRRAIRFTLNRVHRVELRRFSRDLSSWQLETEIRLVHFPVGVHKAAGSASGWPPASSLPSVSNAVMFPMDVRVVMYLNLLALLIVLAMLIDKLA